MNEEVSLSELEKVGSLWAALVMMPQPYMVDAGFSTTNMTLSSLSPAKMGILSLLLSHCSSCDSLPHGLHIVAKHYEGTM